MMGGPKCLRGTHFHSGSMTNASVGIFRGISCHQVQIRDHPFIQLEHLSTQVFSSSPTEEPTSRIEHFLMDDVVKQLIDINQSTLPDICLFGQQINDKRRL